MKCNLCTLSFTLWLLAIPLAAQWLSAAWAYGPDKQVAWQLPGQLLAQASRARTQLQSNSRGDQFATLPAVQSVQPTEVAPGAQLTISGVNFSSSPRDNLVYIGEKGAQIQSASSSTLVITVPPDVRPGKQELIVATRGFRANQFEITIVGPPPELDSVSLSSAAPGATLTISGKNFSTNPRENRVNIGGLSAEVTSASSGSLTVVVPVLASPQYGVSVNVEVAKQKAKKSLSIDIQNRQY